MADSVERAIQTIDGIQKVYNTLQQQTILRGQMTSFLALSIRLNYGLIYLN